ncbi:MAG TPA: lytic transglycosylase domain-containing protein [Streptosporangiaceae bacterium]
MAAASTATAATWSSGVAHAATTTAYVRAVNARLTGQESRSMEAWQFQLSTAAQSERTATEAKAQAAAQKVTAVLAARKAEAARKAAAQRAAALAAAQQVTAQPAATQQTPTVAPAHPSGSAQQIAMSMLSSYGWSSSQFSCLDPLWSRESGWNVTASNPDGAYGIPQAMPGSKMASAGPDWETSAATQIKWGLGYIKDLYGSPCGAWSHEEATGWY